MLIDAILACLIGISSLLALLVVDLYNRSAVLAKMDEEQRRALHYHHWLLSKVTNKTP
jgi:hypothetical protein